MIHQLKLVILCLTFLLVLPQMAGANGSEDLYIMKIKAKDKHERTQIANLGISIERVESDYVMGTGTKSELLRIESLGQLIHSFPLKNVEIQGFPSEDRDFHDYNELLRAIEELKETYPDLLRVEELGRSIEGRLIFNLRISEDPDTSGNKPGIVFMGGHHSREHVSVELPLHIAKKILKLYQENDSRVRSLLAGREIHIIPLVNPDGTEWDIRDNTYHMWRKNKRVNSDGSFGVDLNRNYGFQWGTGGSSTNPRSDVYMGKEPFSEPETQIIKSFVENHTNLTILVSFHTFSELILYPWGHTYDSIANQTDFAVHKTMAEKMAEWNGYTPQQSSDLYIASGDTTDWSYGQHRLISFTFELDPRDFNGGGFYPGQGRLPTVYQKNWEPALYLIGYADNPYRVLQGTHNDFGLSTPLVE